MRFYVSTFRFYRISHRVVWYVANVSEELSAPFFRAESHYKKKRKQDFLRSVSEDSDLLGYEVYVTVLVVLNVSKEHESFIFKQS
jgi:hypothetical protein